MAFENFLEKIKKKSNVKVPKEKIYGTCAVLFIFAILLSILLSFGLQGCVGFLDGQVEKWIN